MEILEHGIYYEKEHIATCVCGCKFKYEQLDIHIDAQTQLTSNPPQYRKFVRCPECDAAIYLGGTITHGITQIYN